MSVIDPSVLQCSKLKEQPSDAVHVRGYSRLANSGDTRWRLCATVQV